MTNKEAPTFATLLEGYLASSGIGVTELARRLTGLRKPDRAAIESRRRPLQRYLRDENVPRPAQRRKIIKALGLAPNAFDAAISAPASKRRKDRMAEIEALLKDLSRAVGTVESPEAESIRGLLAELAAQLLEVQQAGAETTRHLGELDTRVSLLENRDEHGEAPATDQPT